METDADAHACYHLQQLLKSESESFFFQSSDYDFGRCLRMSSKYLMF